MFNLISLFFTATLILLSVVSPITNAQSLSILNQSNSFFSNDVPLSAEEAFSAEIENSGDNLIVILDIEANHYIYKNKIELYYNNEVQGLKGLKDGKIIKDDFFGETEIYELGFSFNHNSKFYKDTDVKIKYQGCSKEFNLCYPPQTKTFKFYGDEKYKTNDISIENEKQNKNYDFSSSNMNKLATTNDTNEILNLINENKDSLFIYIIFIVLGLFIAFTPCLYPILPIVIATTANSNNKKISTLSYILGMIISYATIGLIAGYFDLNLQIFLQNKYFTFFIAAILVILGLYMIGLINFILPAKTNNILTNIINKINTNKYRNQVIIGFLSSLLLSPCSIAPLLGVLIFINQVGNPLFGSMLLGSMAIGIGLPIFILSTSFNKFMPKNGTWMNEFKNIIGIIMFVIPIYMLSGLITETVSYILYSLIFMTYALHILSVNNRKKIGILIFTFSVILLNSKINGSNTIISNETLKLDYTLINNIETLEEFIENSDKPIFIDYYADWCISCVKMNNTTLKNQEVIKSLNNNYFMVKIDLTDITDEKQLIMDKKKVFAIPYYSIIDKNKKEFIYTGDIKTSLFNELLTKHSE